MARTTIRDQRNFITGYIEDTSDGGQRALDLGYRILGYYDPTTGKTVDETSVAGQNGTSSSHSGGPGLASAGRGVPLVGNSSNRSSRSMKMMWRRASWSSVVTM